VKIKIFTVGGTIDKIYFDQLSQYEVGESLVSRMFLEANVMFEFEIEQVMKKDSLHMTDQDRQLLFDKISIEPAKHIFITHGTDSMIKTAQVLSEIKGKVIVLTGALQPSRFRDSDATFNVGFALGALHVLSQGTYVAMNGQILDPFNAQKSRENNRFETI